MRGDFAAAAGSLVLLAVAVLAGFPFEILILLVLFARLARQAEAKEASDA